MKEQSAVTIVIGVAARPQLTPTHLFAACLQCGGLPGSLSFSYCHHNPLNAWANYDLTQVETFRMVMRFPLCSSQYGSPVARLFSAPFSARVVYGANRTKAPLGQTSTSIIMSFAVAETTSLNDFMVASTLVISKQHRTRTRTVGQCLRI